MKQIWQFKIIMLLSLLGFRLSAQIDSTWQQKPVMTISGFADIFYVYDFNQPQKYFRQPFLYNHNRHHEFNLNLGFIKLDIEHFKYRAKLALQTGTYPNDNYAAEQGLFKSIFEANIGVSLNRKNTLWLDVGILPSHIGFESAISIDNWTLTRSVLAENSPYFLSGVKLTYSPTDKLQIAGLIVNGWQRIQRLEGNSLPALGSHVSFTPNEKLALNWSTFIGTEYPDTTRRMRYFNNLYGRCQITGKLALIAGFDIGMQQKNKNSSGYDFWFSPIFIGQFTINKTWKTALRIEYYQDETGIIIPTSEVNGFRTTGFSLNLDYSPVQNILLRVEGRLLNSKGRIFETNTVPTDRNFTIATSIAIKFSEVVTKQ